MNNLGKITYYFTAIGGACDACKHYVEVPDQIDEPGGMECRFVHGSATPLCWSDCPGMDDELSDMLDEEEND